MASEEQKYSAEFKKEVAQKALDQSKQNLDELSEEYDVPVSVILMWATEFEKGGDDVFESEEDTEEEPTGEQEQIDVEISDDRVVDSINFGVMLDQLNYKRLVFWSVFGVIIVSVLVQALFELYQYNQSFVEERVSSESQYYQANQLREEAEQQLNSFGVIDLENEIYRIPIDSAISNMAADEE